MTCSATFINGDTYYSADLNQRNSDFISPGVVTLSDLQVTAPGGMFVQVAGSLQGLVGGNAWLPGGYRFFNSVNTSLALTANSSGNPRIDLVVAGVDTTQSPYLAEIMVITGTPAVSPIAPVMLTTFSGIALATVAVANGASAPGTITDVRAVAGYSVTNLLTLPPVGSSGAMCVVNGQWFISNGTSWAAMAAGASLSSPTMWI